MRTVLAVDIGGTFTDLVAYNLDEGTVAYAKSSTTYDDFVEGILTCLDKAEINISDTTLVKHGSTLVINALIQRKGAKTALITTKGFRDTLEIGRGNRPTPFDLRYRRDPPLVPRPLRFELGGRSNGQGQEIEQLDFKALDQLAEQFENDGIEAVAISFLNAYATPDHEIKAARRLRERLPNVFVSAGTELSREWFEYERSATVSANAFVGPMVTDYIRNFELSLSERRYDGPLYLMGSNGGVLSAERALKEPIRLVESGPVGGCIGAAEFAGSLGLDNVIAFDMGGTTAKCTLISKGRFSVENATYIGGFEKGFPIRAAVIDIVEIGTGGGSIASLDSQNRLHVGPNSAGAEPGPACYGRGGTEPTVTDANLVLGRLNSKRFLGGELELDDDAARNILVNKIAGPLGFDGEDGLLHIADGIITIAVERMAASIRKISVERGLDPREFALLTYGGGGPLHASALAMALGIPLVIVPPEPGNFSATGMLLANPRIDEARTYLCSLDETAIAGTHGAFAEMTRAATERLSDEGEGEISFDYDAEMRYRGQKHSIRIDVRGLDDEAGMRQAFSEEYRRRYGHADETAVIEYVGLHLGAIMATQQPDITRLSPFNENHPPTSASRRVWLPQAASLTETDIYKRESLPPGFEATGPAIIEEYGSTTLIDENDKFSIGALGEIRILSGKPGDRRTANG